MRINKFVALATGLSRRKADDLVARGDIMVNGTPASAGLDIAETDSVTINGRVIKAPRESTTIVLNKPAGYVVSRDGQGSKTIYDLLPPQYQSLKPVGRLDKDSSGLLVLTDDGNLAHQLTHPSFQKTKIYEAKLDKPLEPLHHQIINDLGISLEDGISKLQLSRQQDGDNTRWIVTMHEGRNRQIRRTFAALGYTVTALHRTHFGPYHLGKIASGTSARLDNQ